CKMRHVRWLFVVLAWGHLTSEAVAQSGAPNPITSHYRAYREALATGNLAAAEVEAAAALDASAARDGDGGNTAVLAINLAQTRLSLGRRNEAYEPASRAFKIATAGGSDADPLMPRPAL